MERDNLKITENVALGLYGNAPAVRQCHNHPFDRWTQDEYYSFASFFSQWAAKEPPIPAKTLYTTEEAERLIIQSTKNPCLPSFSVMIPLKYHAMLIAGKFWQIGLLPQNPFFACNLGQLGMGTFFRTGNH